MNTVIPAGYRLTVVSWENDADNYRSLTLAGLSEASVRWLVALCGLLKSNKFGNMYEPSEFKIHEMFQTCLELAKEHRGAWAELLGDVGLNLDDIDHDDFECYIEEELDQLCGYSEHYYTRVVESFVVEYVPAPIELEDVTEQFI